MDKLFLKACSLSRIEPPRFQSVSDSLRIFKCKNDLLEDWSRYIKLCKLFLHIKIWIHILMSKDNLEILICLLQSLRRLLLYLKILRLSHTVCKLRGSFWILNSCRSKISILMLLHCFVFQREPILYTLKINKLNAQN